MTSQSQTQDKPILSFDTFNPRQDIQFGKPKVNDFGGKNVAILNKASKSNVLLNTPLILTWGVQENDFDGKKSYDMALQFPNEEYQTEKSQVFLNALKEYEELLKEACMKNSKEWMNKGNMSPEVVNALWTSMLKYPLDKETREPDYDKAPTIRVKLPYWKETFNTEIYDMEQNQLFPSDDESVTPMQLIPKGVNVAVCMQSGGIWFANGKMGTTWRLFQAIVKPRASLRGRCHIALDVEDKERLEKQVDKEEDKEEEDHVNVESSDDEEEDAPKTPVPSPEPVQAPEPPKKKKKVVRRKKSAD
jgi:hypothetical protein